MTDKASPSTHSLRAAEPSSLPRPLDWTLLQAACAQALEFHRHSGSTPRVPSTVFIGLSGGVDSVVLLSLALAWQRAELKRTTQPLRVVALHAHHGLQAPADAWLQDCVDRCAQAGIELISNRLTLAPQQGSEAAARAARYDFFRRQLHSSRDCLLLAHHADDQAETLLLRVAQGRAVQGMPGSRSLGVGLLVRPLLDQRRKALEAHARQLGLDWVEDPTNAQLAADRNFVRHQWLPSAVARWPDLVTSLTGLAYRQRQQAELLQGLVAPWTQVPVVQAQLPTGPSLLHAWLHSRGEVSVTHLALEEFCAQLSSPSDRSPMLRLTHGELRRYAGAVHYVPKLELAEVALASGYNICSPGELRLPHGRLSISGPVAQFQVRFAQHLKGTSFAPPVRSRRWQEAGVPPWARGSFPQLFAGDERLGLPICDQETLLPQRPSTSATADRWTVLWEPRRGGDDGEKP